MGPFGTANFIGPLIGAVTNIIFLTIAIYCFSPISGGHLQPFITIATFMVRLTSFPRMVLYVAFQLGGAAIAGLLLRASWGNRDFKVGGCFLFTSEGTSIGSALSSEFVGSLTIISLAFGVAIDPRNRNYLGPLLAPFLVACVLGVLVISLGFAKPGYGGPSMNPSRCFGIYVGSSFPAYHWVHWVGPFAAATFHMIVYNLVPPWELRAKAERDAVKEAEMRAAMSPVRTHTGSSGPMATFMPRPADNEKNSAVV
jgi:glycerol uptake facilitator-like aquaporin